MELLERMKLLDAAVRDLENPANYYQGVRDSHLTIVDNILLFKRTTKRDLQEKTFENRPHHRFVLILNLAGSGAVSIDSYAFNLNPGEVLLIAPYQFVHYLNLASDDLLWLFITFETATPEFLSSIKNRPFGVGENEQQVLAAILKHYTRPCALSSGKSSAIILLTSLLLNQMIAQNASDSIQPALKNAQAQGQASSLFEQVNRYLGQNPDSGVRVSDLARKIGLSDSQLRKSFKVVSGISLGRYIKHFQMSKAVALVKNSDMTFSQIALECGFQSLESFSRAFKRMMGTSAREYRRE